MSRGDCFTEALTRPGVGGGTQRGAEKDRGEVSGSPTLRGDRVCRREELSQHLGQRPCPPWRKPEGDRFEELTGLEESRGMVLGSPANLMDLLHQIGGGLLPGARGPGDSPPSPRATSPGQSSQFSFPFWTWRRKPSAPTRVRGPCARRRAPSVTEVSMKKWDLRQEVKMR